MSMFNLDNIDDLGEELAGVKSMTDVFEDDFADDSWTTSYPAGTMTDEGEMVAKRVEFPTRLEMKGSALRGYIEFGRLALTRMRGAWQPMEDAPSVLTLDVFLQSFGEEIGVIVPGEGDKLLAPYSDRAGFANYFQRPRLITGRVWEAKPETAERIGKILIAAGAQDRAGSGRGNNGNDGEVDSSRPWAFDLRLGDPTEVEGGSWANWGVDVGSVDIAVVPYERRIRNASRAKSARARADRLRRAEEAFDGFADGIVERNRRLKEATDLANHADEAMSLQGKVQLNGLQRVLRSLTGVRTYQADGETNYAAREASVKRLVIGGEAFDLAAARPAEATKEFSLDSILAARTRSEDVMSRRGTGEGSVPQIPEEPV
jgi:hypothetical protein